MMNTIQPEKSVAEKNGLAPDTRLGAIHLTVSNLARSLEFYQQALGLQIHQQTQNQAHLGAGGEDLVVLTEQTEAKQVSGHSGLYHFALLVPSRLALAQILQHFAETETPLQGMSDHLVSEAIYLADPDGNGIEVYRDRPRNEWTYAEDGQLNIGTVPLNVAELMGTLNESSKPWQGMPSKTVMGHVHLHVGHLPKAITFYEQLIGFDFIAGYGSQAGFLSVGGYHHHLGLNTWAGVGAPPKPASAVGLRHFDIYLTNQLELENLVKRLDEANWAYQQVEDGLMVFDPAQNAIQFQVR